MKNKFVVLSMALAVFALGACSKCPDVDHTGQFPYSNMRTAGTGTTVYGGDCAVAEPAPTPVIEEKVEPAPVVKKAAPVFSKKLRK